METTDDSTETIECGAVSADIAARYAFLRAVSHLPHFEFSQKPSVVLGHTVEAEIIPRLILANRSEARSKRTLPVAGVTPAEVQKFSEIILLDKPDEALGFVDGLSGRSVPIENILLDLLAPTAMKLGAMWEDDDVDFLSVTVSLGRLQRVLRHLSGISQRVPLSGKPCHKVLLSAVPGETHIFSLLLVDQFFRADGWDTWTLPGATGDELIDIVGREPFALVGLSISCDVCIGELRRTVPAIRDATINKSLKIMIGGPAINRHPELLLEISADGTAGDGPSALLEASRLVEDAADRRVR